MRKETKTVRLHNVLFPVWMLMLFPQMWLIVLPGNFLIDSLVLLLAMAALQLPERKAFYKTHILRIFGFGLLADAIGAVLLLVLMMGFELGRMGDELYLTLPALLLSAVLIYIFNSKVTFKDEEKVLRHKLALTFAVATAPYTFLIPSSLLYGY